MLIAPLITIYTPEGKTTSRFLEINDPESTVLTGYYSEEFQ